MTVDQMISIIKGQTRQVPSSRQVNNILSKNPKLFFKHGKTKTKSALNSRYTKSSFGLTSTTKTKRNRLKAAAMLLSRACKGQSWTT